MAEAQYHPLVVAYRNGTIEIDELSPDSTISNLASHCATQIGLNIDEISLLIMPKPGFQRFPFSDRKLSDVLTPKSRIKLVGTPTNELQGLEDQSVKAQAAATRRREVHKAHATTATRRRDWKQVQEESTYTFHSIEPLKYLPNPEKSRRYLERLANDPGIKASMRKHKFSVGLLTEMNPAEHTTHESKTLGLNRNRGEVIELRLRTDRYDGYRDYKVIRKTLCHELSHNVWGDHDRNFWNLTKEIEQEVERNDTLHGGHRLTGQEFYNPEDNGEDAEHADHGGWVGGEYVLGRSDSSTPNAEETSGLSRRELMARAAALRQQNQERAAEKIKEEQPEHGQGQQ